ncbi:hypothetical protein [Dehalobacterium formicoaceticum]|uniref:Polyketide cyclase / dehydrase and lipid transport n=1 Tax=Dehalobacterium formicoaceticum TaxID=51515 RepID=A0ABT1Y2K0_9FIRM|nr:hypothetical protein [Dehalobacterium formicoaceticum]MCR6544179.1 hypothetical protein [Dehalobacterium formicoaceticum]
MGYAESSILIAKNVAEVFQFLLAGENNKFWRSGILDIQRVPDQPVVVGTKFIQGMKGPFGIRIKADYKIISCEMNKRISFQVVNGPTQPVGTFLLKKRGKGTYLTFSMEDTRERKGNLLGIWKKNHHQRVVGAVKNLKTYLESPAYKQKVLVSEEQKS